MCYSLYDKYADHDLPLERRIFCKRELKKWSNFVWMATCYPGRYLECIDAFSTH